MLPILSICVVTMNRAEQLREALESCLACALPEQTEFVVIDNASTDHTKDVVYDVLENCGYEFYYEKMSENLGCGGGRNYAFCKATGQYTYALDDDAVIDDKNPEFFVQAVEILNQNPDMVSLTTQIYDIAWQRNRVDVNGRKIRDNLYKIQMFCGGSHFLRKDFYTDAPYLSNKYGYEEIPPSLRAMNAGKINGFCSELRIIHKPLINKWDWSDEKNQALLVKGIALSYAIKKMMYPRLASPLLVLAHSVRIKKYLANVPDGKKRVNEAVRDFSKEYPIQGKIKIMTVVRMFFDFGFSIF